MKKAVIVLLVLAVVAGVGGWWLLARDDGWGEWDDFPWSGNYTVDEYVDVGLTSEERHLWHRNPEGSEMLPLSFLACLEDVKTGKPFLHVLPRFGFLIDPDNEDGLPVGWAVHEETKFEGIEFGSPIKNVGVNCAACHTGQIEYDGRKLRIDGAPNMVDIEAFANDLKDSLVATMKSPEETFLFARRLIKFHHRPKVKGEFLELDDDTYKFLMDLDEKEVSAKEPDSEIADFIGDAFEHASKDDPAVLARAHLSFDQDIMDEGGDTKSVKGHVGEIVSSLGKVSGFLKRRYEFIKRLEWAMENQTEAGPGRADSFDLIRDLLWSGEHRIEMTAPVSIPHLFYLSSTDYIHWDGNTNSVMQRNLAQAIALGADFDPKTMEVHVLPRKIHELEEVAKKLTPPKWPGKYLGSLDAEMVAKGKVLFDAHCHQCHDKTTMRTVPLAEVGTDPTRVMNYNQMLGNEPFHEALEDLAERIVEAVFRDNQIHGVQAEKMVGKDPRWTATDGYVARPLAGIWATAPYLHNASVPTLWDLLQPASDRPIEFVVGHRDFDPVKVGFENDPQPDPNDWAASWVMKTEGIQGNSNRGHEYGTNLGDSEKMQLIEYLKSL